MKTPRLPWEGNLLARDPAPGPKLGPVLGPVLEPEVPDPIYGLLREHQREWHLLAAHLAVEMYENPACVRRLAEGLAGERLFEQTPSVVYFIQRGSEGSVKIGVSDRPGSRLAALQTSHDEQLFIRAWLPGDVALERFLHAVFARDRLRGEWFKPSAVLLDFMRAVATKYAAPAERKKRVGSPKRPRRSP